MGYTNQQTDCKKSIVKNHRIYLKIIWQKCSVCGPPARLFKPLWGWVDGWGLRLGLANMCILHHKGIQLRLAYSWARPAIFVAGKSRWGMFLFLFLHFHSCSLSSLSLSVPLSFSPFLWETTQNHPQGLTCHWTPTQAKSIHYDWSKNLAVGERGGVPIDVYRKLQNRL